MLRITLIELASFFLPFLLFFIWRWQSSADHPLSATPVLRLAALGAGLAVLVMLVLVVLDSARGGHEGDRYVPPQMIDGEIVPGYFIPADETVEDSADNEADEPG